MNDLIDRQELLAALPHVDLDEDVMISRVGALMDIADLIISQPTVDAVQVVRCKDCKYAHMTYNGECKYCDVWGTDDPLYLPADYFCVSGERKEVSE